MTPARTLASVIALSAVGLIALSSGALEQEGLLSGLAQSSGVSEHGSGLGLSRASGTDGADGAERLTPAVRSPLRIEAETADDRESDGSGGDFEYVILVLDGGRPVSNAEVRWSTPGLPRIHGETRTGADGSVRLPTPSPTPTAIALEVQADGYALCSQVLRPLRDRTAGSGAFEVALYPAATLELALHDADGSPAPHHPLELRAVDLVERRASSPRSRQFQTGADGRAVVSGLLPGKWRVRIASAEGGSQAPSRSFDIDLGSREHAQFELRMN